MKKEKLQKDSEKAALAEKMMSEDLNYPRYEDRDELVSRLKNKFAKEYTPSLEELIQEYRDSQQEPKLYSSEKLPYNEDYMDEAKLTNYGMSSALGKKMRWEHARPSNVNQWEINRNRSNRSLANKAASLTDMEKKALDRSLKTMSNVSDLLKPSDAVPVVPSDKEFLKKSYSEADELSDSVMNNRRQRLKEVLNSPQVSVDSLPEEVVGEAKESMRSKSSANAKKFGKLLAKIAAPAQLAITGKEVYDELQKPEEDRRILSKVAESLAPISQEEIQKLRQMEQERLAKEEQFFKEISRLKKSR